MPQMNGYELIRRIKTLQPKVRVVLISAFEINDLEFSKVLPSVKRWIYPRAYIVEKTNKQN
jgi:CheY-like chemotaxis protein